VEAYSEGKCRLAARAQWIINAPQFDYKSTPWTPSVIGGVCTQSTLVAESQTEGRDSDIETVEAELPEAAGAYSQAVSAPVLVRMPDSPDEHQGDGLITHLGLSTTIYPAKPKALSACVAPSQPQPHSSAIYSSTEITALRMRAVPEPVYGTQAPYASIEWEIVHGITPAGKSLLDDKGNVIRSDLFDGFNSEPFIDVPFFDVPLTLSASAGGIPAAQNTWWCQQELGKELRIRPYLDTLARGQLMPFFLPLPAPGEQFGSPASYGIGAVARGGVFEVDGVEATAVAYRPASTYADMETTSAHDLKIDLTVKAYGYRDTYENKRGVLSSFPAWRTGHPDDGPERAGSPQVVWVDVGEVGTELYDDPNDDRGPYRVAAPDYWAQLAEFIDEHLANANGSRSHIIAFMQQWELGWLAGEHGVGEYYTFAYGGFESIAGAYAWHGGEGWKGIGGVWVQPFAHHQPRGGYGKEFIGDPMPGGDNTVESRVPFHRHYTHTFTLSHTQEATLAAGGTVRIRTGRIFGVANSQGNIGISSVFQPSEKTSEMRPGGFTNQVPNADFRFQRSYLYETVWEISKA
jgi:hypothetical protein